MSKLFQCRGRSCSLMGVAVWLAPLALGQDQPPKPLFPAPRLWKDFRFGIHATVSPDGTLIAVASGLPRRIMSHTTFVFDRATGKEKYHFPGNNDKSGSEGIVNFTPDGKRLISIQERAQDERIKDHDIRVTDVATGKQLRVFPLGEGQYIYEPWHYAVSDTVLVVAGTKQAATVYDLATGKALGDLTGDLPGIQRPGAMALSPDGRWLVATARRTANNRLTSGEIHLWDVRKLSHVGKIHENKGRIRGLAISPDGNHVAFSAVSAPYIYVIDRATGAEKARCEVVFRPCPSRLRFTVDGKTVVAGGVGPNNGLAFWDWRTSKEVRGGFPEGAKKVARLAGAGGEKARKAWRWGEAPDFSMSGDGKVIAFMPAEGKLYLVEPSVPPEPPPEK